MRPAEKLPALGLFAEKSEVARCDDHLAEKDRDRNQIKTKRYRGPGAYDDLVENASGIVPCRLGLHHHRVIDDGAAVDDPQTAGPQLHQYLGQRKPRVPAAIPGPTRQGRGCQDQHDDLRVSPHGPFWKPMAARF